MHHTITIGPTIIRWKIIGQFACTIIHVFFYLCYHTWIFLLKNCSPLHPKSDMIACQLSSSTTLCHFVWWNLRFPHWCLASLLLLMPPKEETRHRTRWREQGRRRWGQVVFGAHWQSKGQGRLSLNSWGIIFYMKLFRYCFSCSLPKYTDGFNNHILQKKEYCDCPITQEN
jgi:hypothetical protein